MGVLPHEVIHEPKLVATLPSSTQGFHHSCDCFHLSQPDCFPSLLPEKGARGELVGVFCRPGQAVGTSLLLPFWLCNSVTWPHPTAQQIILLTPWGKKKESGDFDEQLCVSATKAHAESLHPSTPSSLKHPGTLTPLAPASLSDPVESPATNPLTHPAPITWAFLHFLNPTRPMHRSFFLPGTLFSPGLTLPCHLHLGSCISSTETFP